MDQNSYQGFQTPETSGAPAWAQSSSTSAQQPQQGAQQAAPQYGQPQAQAGQAQVGQAVQQYGQQPQQQYGAQPTDASQAWQQQPQQAQWQQQGYQQSSTQAGWQQNTTQGYQQPQQGYIDPNGYQQGYPAPASPAPKEKMVAGLLAILLGSLGIHKFYLGKKKPAIIMLLVTLVGGIVTFGIAAGVMGLIGLIEGIMYLTKSDQEFYQIYVAGDKNWF